MKPLLTLMMAPLLLAAGAPDHTRQRAVILQAPPLRGIPVPPQPPGTVPAPAAGGFVPAPVPDRDMTGPALPRATGEPSLAPSLFTRRNQYRGDAIDPASSAQSEQERNIHPGAGFNLRMPLNQK